MTVRLQRTDDIAHCRRLVAREFPGYRREWELHTWWLAVDDEKIVGFCSAVREKNFVFLSTAAVFPQARGAGLQRRMIAARVRWAQRQPGVDRAITYTVLHNYESMVNLLKCGFRFYRPPKALRYKGDQAHYFVRHFKA